MHFSGKIFSGNDVHAGQLLRRVTGLALAALFATVIVSPAQGQEDGATTASATQQAPGVTPCTDLPTGQLSDEELARLVPEGSPGKVRIRWRTESQEECYGFNIYRRSDAPDSQFAKINRSIIPGEGSTNIPRDYCYEDNSVERGKTYFYYIEEVSNQGVATKLEDTLGPDGKGTRAKVKMVGEEREWLRKKALGDNAAPTTGTGTGTGTAPASAPSASAPQAPAPVQMAVKPAAEVPSGNAGAARNPLE